MTEKLEQASDYKTCPLKVGQEQIVGCNRYLMVDRECDGTSCAWWDAKRDKCGVLSKQ